MGNMYPIEYGRFKKLIDISSLSGGIQYWIPPEREGCLVSASC
jgi:hypothetical protein